MASKPGRPPVKTSFKPGNKAAEGNDKTLRLSTWLDNELKRELDQVDEYGEKMIVARKIAADMVKTLMETDDAKTKLEYFKELADRTEGKAKQSTDITSGGEKIVIPILGGTSEPDTTD